MNYLCNRRSICLCQCSCDRLLPNAFTLFPTCALSVSRTSLKISSAHVAFLVIFRASIIFPRVGQSLDKAQDTTINMALVPSSCLHTFLSVQQAISYKDYKKQVAKQDKVLPLCDTESSIAWPCSSQQYPCHRSIPDICVSNITARPGCSKYLSCISWDRRSLSSLPFWTSVSCLEGVRPLTSGAWRLCWDRLTGLSLDVLPSSWTNLLVLRYILCHYERRLETISGQTNTIFHIQLPELFSPLELGPRLRAQLAWY